MSRRLLASHQVIVASDADRRAHESAIDRELEQLRRGDLVTTRRDCCGSTIAVYRPSWVTPRVERALDAGRECITLEHSFEEEAPDRIRVTTRVWGPPGSRHHPRL